MNKQEMHRAKKAAEFLQERENWTCEYNGGLLRLCKLNNLLQITILLGNKYISRAYTKEEIAQDIDGFDLAKEITQLFERISIVEEMKG